MCRSLRASRPTLALFIFALIIFSLSSLPSLAAAAQSTPITLSLDATEAPRRIFHAKLNIPASPGSLTLLYPKWLPGNHRPTGPIANLVGLHMIAAGKTLTWLRNDVNMYAFHCEVPAGANSVEATFDYVTPSRGPGRFDPAATDQLMILNWNLVVLYPQGKPAADYTYKTTLHLPVGWKFGTALPITRQSGQTVEFAPVSLVTLIDSPVLAGSHFRALPLPLGGSPPQELDLAADSDAAVDISHDLAASYDRLAAEASALFGTHHFRDYHFLLALSDQVGFSGLEHHESSDNRAPERTLIDENGRKIVAGLLPHEFVHSWNGKYRRPAGLLSADFQQPMKGELLWVYEGLTEYLGELLAARSGLETAQQFRENLALTAAAMDHRAGRAWRPLEDTAVSAQTLYEAAGEWVSERRGADFYAESVPIWLEVDTIIRHQTRGRSSLDDFCKVFFGGQNVGPEVKPYTLADLIFTLNQITPYDWASFLQTRIYSIAPRAPLAGIEQSGWRLVYGETPNEIGKAGEKFGDIIDFSSSIGMVVRKQAADPKVGIISDVVPGMSAANSGIAPGMKLVAVNGRRWTPQILRTALRSGENRLELLVENVGFFKTYALKYSGGQRFPHLDRDTSRPDMLTEMIQPHASRAAK